MKPIASVAVVAALFLATAAQGADKKRCLDSAPRGQELRDQGKLIEAREQFVVCADTECPPPVPTYCTEWLDDVNKKIPSIVIRVTDDAGKDVTDATITLDDHAVSADAKPIDVNPGRHHLHVSRAGSRDADQAVVAAVGERGRIVSMKLEPEGAATKPATSDFGSKLHSVPVGSWIGWGAGAVGLIGFSVFGVKANLDYGDYKSSCGNHCPKAARDDVEGTMVVADVFLVVGLVGAAVGTVIYLLSPPPVERTARASR